MDMVAKQDALYSDNIHSALELKVFNTIGRVADEEGLEAYLVGGYVRDLLLNRESKDIDIVVVGSGILFAKKVAKALGDHGNLSVFKNFKTANLKIDELEIEFVGARKESYRQDSRKPIVEEGSLDDDLKRRDLTINALAVALNGDNYGEVIDYFNGWEDLANGLVRTPLDPVNTFSDDPLRMIRAIRFASQLQFEIRDATFEAIQSNRERLEIVSQERITDELHKILASPKPSYGFKLLLDGGLLGFIFPELENLCGVETIYDQSHKDNFYHTIKVVDNVAEMSDDLWLRWAALLHDIGKPPTKKFDPQHGWTFHGHEVVGAKMVPKIFKRLRLPMNDKMKFVQKLVRLHLRPIALTTDVTDSAIRRLNYDAGDDIDALLTLCKADITSKNKEKVSRFTRRFDEVWQKIQDVEEKDKIRNFEPPVKGEEIMETFGIGPSKEVGLIKDAIKEAVLNGDIENNYEQAREFMLKKGDELGLKAKGSH